MTSNMEQPESGIHLHPATNVATVATVATTIASCVLSSPTAAEFESLKQALLEKDNQLLLMENACLRESERQAELEDSVIAWQDKYDRLYESHKRVQKVNQSLEDKLLKMVDRNTGERAQLTSDVATLSVRLAQANFNIAKLQREIERYKADINLAIQLLQCKPDGFMPQKISSLPIDIQSKVSAYMRLETNSHSDSEGSGVGVATSASYKVLPASESPPPAPCPFPPTAMVYSMRGLDAKNNANSANHPPKQQSNNNPKEYRSNCSNNNNNNNTNINNMHTNNNNNNNNNSNNKSSTGNMLGADPDLISPLTMAKFLEHELKAEEIKHCDTCQCSKQDLMVLADVSRFYTVATQTPLHFQTTNLNEALSGQLCMRCHSNLNSPSRTNSPFLMKVVKSSDSVISETKSSVSDLNDVDKLFTPPPKKDDLMVNPILGHHRLCDRTAGTSGSISATVPATITGTINQSKGLDSRTLKTTSAATMLYPTTHLGTYEAEKYLLETNTLAGIREHIRSDLRANNVGNCQRRFLDGGGSALCLLNGNMGQGKNDAVQEMYGLYDVVVEEEKPLLCEELGFLQRDAVKRDIASLDVLQEAIKSPTSTCSANDIHKKLAKSAVTSSMNSLWSKGSNCENSKMFENFNRNLIRTIKSENPRYRGPRLCAMRIQRTENGQSNILLDNMESLETITPVIYRRRERLLDEELDDAKDIITSGSPGTGRVELEPSITNGNVGEQTVQDAAAPEAYGHVYVDEQSRSKSMYTEALKHEIELECEQAMQQECPAGEAAIANGLVLNYDLEHKTGGPKNLNGCLETDITAAADLNLPEANVSTTFSKPASKLTSSSYEVLRNDFSSKNSINSKSCTQSSSMSEVINLQESVILRRQQLSRVAEWVQSNTQQLEQQQNMENASSTTPQCDSSGTDRQSSFSTLDQLDSVSIEKLSMDSGYKTTPQPQTNGFAQANRKENDTETSLSPKTDMASNSASDAVANVADGITITTTTISNNNNKNNNNSQPTSNSTALYNYRRALRTGLPITIPSVASNACSADSKDDAVITQIDNQSVQMLPEQPTCDILNYKYYPCERDKSRAIDAELHMTSTNVDIAQMEYNVKQFLLKQNEWSMRAAGGCGGTAATASAVASVITATTQKPKGIRRSKLFCSVGIGPGVGERVRTELPTNTNANGNCNSNSVIARDGSNRKTTSTSTPHALQTTIPQRTETNL